VYVQEIARAWASAGHEVTMFVAAVPGRPERETVDGYQLVRGGSRLGVYRAARHYYEAEAKGRVDAVLDVVNTRPFMTPRYVQEPVVTLIHQLAKEVWHFEAPPGLAHLGRYVLEPRWLRAYANRPVLTVSASSRASLLDYGLHDVTVVPEGVRQPEFRPVPKTDRPTLIFVGRLSTNKRPDHAIEAYRQLRALGVDAQLWVVGDGPMAAKLRASSPEGVTFFGRVDHARKEELMGGAHALVATSVREGWGLIVSEAALLGTRSIGYDVAGLEDSVPAASGVLVTPDPASLAAKAAEILPAWVADGPFDPGDAGVGSWEDAADAVLAAITAAAGTVPARRAPA
jgi:glycosyltransferase involved in cell wall biosynthesis